MYRLRGLMRVFVPATAVISVHIAQGEHFGRYYWGCRKDHGEGNCGLVEWIAEDNHDPDVSAESDMEEDPTDAPVSTSTPPRSPLTVGAFGRNNRGHVGGEARRTAVDIGVGAASAIGAEPASPEVQAPLLEPMSPDYGCNPDRGPGYVGHATFKDSLQFNEHCIDDSFIPASYSATRPAHTQGRAVDILRERGHASNAVDGRPTQSSEPGRIHRWEERLPTGSSPPMSGFAFQRAPAKSYGGTSRDTNARKGAMPGFSGTNRDDDSAYGYPTGRRDNTGPGADSTRMGWQ